MATAVFRLQDLRSRLLRVKDKTKRVFFDFGRFYPDPSPLSFHCHGDELGMGFVGHGITSAAGGAPAAPTVRELAAMLREIEGEELRGLCGFVMVVGPKTRMRVAKRGVDCGATFVAGVTEPPDRHAVIIDTVQYRPPR